MEEEDPYLRGYTADLMRANDSFWQARKDMKVALKKLEADVKMLDVICASIDRRGEHERSEEDYATLIKYRRGE